MNWGFVLVWISLVEREDYMIPGVFFLGTIWYSEFTFYSKVTFLIVHHLYSWTIVYDTIYGCQVGV